MTIAKILNARKALDNVIQNENNKTMEAKTSYKIVKFIMDTNPVEIKFNEEVDRIRGEFGVSQEDGTVTVPDDKIEEFYKAVNEAGSAEVEENYIKFDLVDFEGVKVGPNEMVALMAFINE